MNFSKALKALKKGELICRESWALENYLYLFDDQIWMNEDSNGNLDEPWTIYHEDILAEDWILVELQEIKE